MKKEISILGTIYKIEMKSQEDLQDMINTTNFLYGCTDFEKKIIYIYCNLTGLQEEETLMHEVTHCFFRESGLDTQCDYARNEELVDWIAIQFPKMVKTYKDCGLSFLVDKKKDNNKKKGKKENDITTNNGCSTNPASKAWVGTTNKH